MKKAVIIIIALLATSTLSAVIPLSFSQPTPSITCVPSIFYVGDQFSVNGANWDAYVGDSVTIYFQYTAGGSFTLLSNITIPSAAWNVILTVPQSWGGQRLVDARTGDGTIVLASDTVTVLPKLEVTSDPIYNDQWQKVLVSGTGFSYGDAYSPDGYLFYIDNSLYLGRSENWSAAIDDRGRIITEFAAAGFRPGLHEVHVIGDYGGAFPWVVAALDTFTVLTNGDPIVEYLISINGTVVSISDGMVTLETAMGQTTVSLAQLDAKIVALDGTIATISTTVGQINTDLSAIGGTITTINGNVATIKTDVGTIEGKITDIEGTLATVETELGTVQVDLSDAKTQLSDMTVNDDESPSVDMLPVWVAVIFALVAAIGSITGVIIIQQKMKKM